MWLEIIKKIIFASLVSLVYALRYELSGFKVLTAVSLGGAISWLSYQLAIEAGISLLVANFIAALIMSTYAEIMARIMRMPVTVFLIVAMLPLVPGLTIYQTMVEAVQGNSTEALNLATEAFAISGALTMGNLTASTLASYLTRTRLGIKKKRNYE